MTPSSSSVTHTGVTIPQNRPEVQNPGGQDHRHKESTVPEDIASALPSPGVNAVTKGLIYVTFLHGIM